jgi:hypothetical protein
MRIIKWLLGLFSTESPVPDAEAKTEGKLLGLYEEGMPVLHQQVALKHPWRVIDLIDNYYNRYNVDERNSLDQTPLHYAAAYGHIDTVEALIERGADRKAKDCYGQTPSDFAARYEHPDVVQLLDDDRRCAEMKKTHAAQDENAVREKRMKRTETAIAICIIIYILLGGARVILTCVTANQTASAQDSQPTK